MFNLFLRMMAKTIFYCVLPFLAFKLSIDAIRHDKIMAQLKEAERCENLRLAWINRQYSEELKEIPLEN